MFANQLDATDNTLGALIPAPPSGSKVLSWNGSGYTEYEYGDFGLGAGDFWAPDGALVMNPGEGFFFSNPTGSDVTLTLVGEVPQNADSNTTIPQGFSMKSSTVPQSGDLEADMGFPSASGDKILKWTGAGYAEYEYGDFGLGAGDFWAPSNPTVEVGEGFFVQKGSATAWDRNFSVNN
jgi:hypothetical protein